MIVWEPTPLQRSKYVSTGSRDVDALLGGGIQLGLITEVSGEAGSGKSLLGYTLAITAQLPQARGGIAGSVLHLYSPKTCVFSTGRLLNIGTRFGFENDEVLKGIYVRRIGKATDLIDVFAEAERKSFCGTGLVIVVIDDLASLLREQFPNLAHYQPRRRATSDILDGARRLAVNSECAVVFMNEVRAHPITDSRTGREIWFNKPFSRPVWSRPNINRISLLRHVNHRGQLVGRSCKRYVSPTRSPATIDAAVDQARFKITDFGLCDDE